MARDEGGGDEAGGGVGGACAFGQEDGRVGAEGENLDGERGGQLDAPDGGSGGEVGVGGRDGNGGCGPAKGDVARRGGGAPRRGMKAEG